MNEAPINKHHESRATSHASSVTPYPSRFTSHASPKSGHVQSRRGRVLMGPARGDDLGARIELDALDTVHVQIAEEGILPPAKGKKGDRHRDRNVYADHADLDLALEAARRSARLGEQRRAVRVG